MMAMVSCVSMVTPATFVFVWVGAGIGASLFQLYAWQHRLPFGLNGKEPPSRFVEHRAGGASGSLFGIYAAMAIRNPAMKMMIIPFPMGIPAGVLLSAAIVYSLLAMREGWQPSIGHAGHLGGAAVGMVWGVASLALRVRRV
jgi:membrane associated rhomboid family serine protease